MLLNINMHERTTNVVTFSLEGSLDTSTYLLLERRLDQALQSETTLIIFDLHGVEYISSAGVRVILKAKKALKKRNGNLFLLNLQPKIRKVLEFINQLPSMEAFPAEDLDLYLDQMQRETTKDHQ